MEDICYRAIFPQTSSSPCSVGDLQSADDGKAWVINTHWDLAHWVVSIKKQLRPELDCCVICCACFCNSHQFSAPASSMTCAKHQYVPHLWPHKTKPGVCRRGSVYVHGEPLAMMSDRSERFLVPKGGFSSCRAVRVVIIQSRACWLQRRSDWQQFLNTENVILRKHHRRTVLSSLTRNSSEVMWPVQGDQGSGVREPTPLRPPGKQPAVRKSCLSNNSSRVTSDLWTWSQQLRVARPNNLPWIPWDVHTHNQIHSSAFQFLLFLSYFNWQFCSTL